MCCRIGITLRPSPSELINEVRTNYIYSKAFLLLCIYVSSRERQERMHTVLLRHTCLVSTECIYMCGIYSVRVCDRIPSKCHRLNHQFSHLLQNNVGKQKGLLPIYSLGCVCCVTSTIYLSLFLPTKCSNSDTVCGLLSACITYCGPQNQGMFGFF